MELRAEDQGSAILAMILTNKGNGSSTEVMYRLAVQGTVEGVRPVVCYENGLIHQERPGENSSSRRILQVEVISMRPWRQEEVAYRYGKERILSKSEQVRNSTLKGVEVWALSCRKAKETAVALDGNLA